MFVVVNSPLLYLHTSDCLGPRRWLQTTRQDNPSLKITLLKG